MATFMIPRTITTKLDASFGNFQWGYKENGQPKIHPRAWDTLYTPKSIGGLGL